MGCDTRRRHLDWKDEAQSEYERARAAERERGVRLLEHFAILGPENEGLMALTLRTMQFWGLLDGATWTELYQRAMLLMGSEAATRVFYGEEAVSTDVDEVIREILEEGRGRAKETQEQAEQMAGRLGLDPGDIDVRLGEEGARRARAAGAEAVEQGKVIYVDERRADPQTSEGREVLAHEVAHVAQVEKGRVPAGVEAAEAEASRLGEALAKGQTVEAPTVALEPQAVAAHQPKSNNPAKQPDHPKTRLGGPVKITVVDDSDIVGWLAGAVRVGEIDADFVEDMVENVLAEANGKKVQELIILGHGAPGYQSVGAGREYDKSGERSISLEILPEITPILSKLTPHFMPDALVVLEGCNVAEGDRGLTLLQELSKIWKVPVKAGTGKQRPLVPGMEGSEVTCKPPPGNYENGESVCTVEE